jgi:3-hydroxyacyl-CoA dehydrogenase
VSRVAVVGAGTLGNGIAHVFAQHGWGTALVDVSRDALDRAVQTISANLDRQVKKGGVSAAQKDETLGRSWTPRPRRAPFSQATRRPSRSRASRRKPSAPRR